MLKMRREQCKEWLLAWAPLAKKPTDWLGWFAVLLPTYFFALAIAVGFKQPWISLGAGAVIFSVVFFLGARWLVTDGYDSLQGLVGDGQKFTPARNLYWTLIAAFGGVIFFTSIIRQHFKAAVVATIIILLLGLGGDWAGWRHGSLTKMYDTGKVFVHGQEKP